MGRRLVIFVGLFIMVLSIMLSHSKDIKRVIVGDEVIEWNSYGVDLII